jgi:hypothetical protein
MPLIILLSGDADADAGYDARDSTNGGVGGDVHGACWPYANIINGGIGADVGSYFDNFRFISDGGLGGDTAVAAFFARRALNGAVGGDVLSGDTFARTSLNGGRGDAILPSRSYSGGYGGDRFVAGYPGVGANGGVGSDICDCLDFFGDIESLKFQKITLWADIGGQKFKVSSANLTSNVGGLAACRLTIPDIAYAASLSDAIEDGGLKFWVAYGDAASFVLYDGSISAVDTYQGASSSSIIVTSRAALRPRSKRQSMTGSTYRAVAGGKIQRRFSWLHPFLRAGDWLVTGDDDFFVKKTSTQASPGRITVTATQGDLPADVSVSDRWPTVSGAVATSGLHTAAKDGLGNVYTWGWNYNSESDPTIEPGGLVDVTDVDTARFSGASKVFAFDGKTYVVGFDGKLYGWGNNADGLINPTSADTHWRDPSAVLFDGCLDIYPGLVVTAENELIHFSAASTARIATSIAQVVDGFVLTTSGDVYIWRKTGDVVTLDDYPVYSGVKKIVKGSYHTLLLLEEGSFVGLGTNQAGEIDPYSDMLKYETFSLPQMFGVVDIAAAFRCSFILDFNGDLFATGQNQYGEVKPSDPGGASYDRSTPIFSDVVAISAQRQTVVVMTSGGNVYGWGFNGNRQAYPASENMTAPYPDTATI